MNLTRVWGADRKFCPEGHCLASRGCAEWCKTVIPRDGIFFPHRTLMFDSFSCIPIDFRMFYLKSSIYYHTQWCWRGTFFKMTSLWCRNDVNLRQSYVTSYTIYANRIHVKMFFLGWDNMGEIRFSIPSENLGFPYLVCKNMVCLPCRLIKTTLKYPHGWIVWASFSTVFQTYQDDGRVNMKGSVQWSAI